LDVGINKKGFKAFLTISLFHFASGLKIQAWAYSIMIGERVTFSLIALFSGLYYKCLMIVSYDRNDRCQYYNTKITIVIDDPSQL